MIILLEEYISLVSSSYMSPDNDRVRNYLIPSETVSPYEWADFDNVYQVHSPTTYLDAAIRDVSELVSPSISLTDHKDPNALLLLFPGETRF